MVRATNAPARKNAFYLWSEQRPAHAPCPVATRRIAQHRPTPSNYPRTCLGRGKISELMGDFAKGIKSFKKGLTEEEKADTEPVKTDPKTIDHQPAPASTATVTETRKAG